MAFESGQWGPDTFIDSEGATTLIGATVASVGYVCVVDSLGNLTITGPAADAIVFTVTPAAGAAYTVTLPVAPLVSELEDAQELALAAETPAGATAKAAAAVAADLARQNGTYATQAALATHEADTTNVHGIADTSALLTTTAAPELIRDTIGTALVAGTNVTITPNDGGDTITIAATGGATAGAAPDALTGSPTMLAYWKASSLGLADGAAVTSWADSSGMGNTLTQSDATKQPVYKAAASVPWLNGKPAVRFDGSNDVLTRTASVTSPSLAQFTFALVVYMRPGISNSSPICFSTGSQNADLAYESNAWKQRGGGATTANTTGTFLQTSGVHVLVAVYDGANQHLYIDGVMMAFTATTGAITPTSIYMGGLNATPVYAWQGDIAEVATYSVALTQAQIDQLTKGWAAAYRLPVVNPF